MIVPSEFSQAYGQFKPTLEKLKARADPFLRGIARELSGQYSSRVKPDESLFLKVEKEGPLRPFEDIYDLFAATIIVPSLAGIPQVRQKIVELDVFEVEELSKKRGNPEEFIYNHLHLILKLRQEPGREQEDTDISGIKFELQLKTIMQAASSSVSRDLGYKTPRLSWERARLAGRIQALVEMADDLLARLADPSEAVVEEGYEKFDRLNKIIVLLEGTLAPEQMPVGDRRRVAVTVDGYLQICRPRMSIDDLTIMLDKEDYARIREAVSISAAESVFIVLFREGRLSSGPSSPSGFHGNRRFLITSEMIALCSELSRLPANRRVSLGQ